MIESIWDYINSLQKWQGVPFIPWAIFMLVVWIIADALDRTRNKK